jgi:hypothetical protein
MARGRGRARERTPPPLRPAVGQLDAQLIERDLDGGVEAGDETDRADDAVADAEARTDDEVVRRNARRWKFRARRLREVDELSQLRGSMADARQRGDRERSMTWRKGWAVTGALEGGEKRKPGRIVNV